MRLALLLFACSSTQTPSCNPPDGGNCLCSSTDTVRNCSDGHGAQGLQYCDSGMWTACALFVDGFVPD